MPEQRLSFRVSSGFCCLYCFGFSHPFLVELDVHDHYGISRLLLYISGYEVRFLSRVYAVPVKKTIGSSDPVVHWKHERRGDERKRSFFFVLSSFTVSKYRHARI